MFLLFYYGFPIAGAAFLFQHGFPHSAPAAIEIELPQQYRCKLPLRQRMWC